MNDFTHEITERMNGAGWSVEDSWATAEVKRALLERRGDGGEKPGSGRGNREETQEEKRREIECVCVGGGGSMSGFLRWYVVSR